MVLVIKNMVSKRCKRLVKAELEAFGLHCIKVELGFVEVVESILPKRLNMLKNALLDLDFELIEDKKQILVERIKALVIDLVHSKECKTSTTLSQYISTTLHYDYTYLANVFSQIKGTTLEHYVIANKVEHVKELLAFGDLSLTEIAYRMQYSSVAHLSSQFKKVAGCTPTNFKQARTKQLIALEDL